jgi:hypothetical protein
VLQLPVADSGDRVQPCHGFGQQAPDGLLGLQPPESAPALTGGAPDGRPAEESEAEALAGISAYLRPLARDWQSTKHGHLRARPSGDGLEVCLEGGAQVVGRVAMHTEEQEGHEHVVFELFGPEWSTWAWLDTTRSKKKHVVWLDSWHQDMDMWDCELLDTVRKAAAWVEDKHGLVPNLSAGLAHLPQAAETTESPVTVGLCTATMNRLWQLRHALPLNIIHLWPHRKWARLHVVDFGSTDGTLDFILRTCRIAIEIGLLRVYTTNQLPHWHASVAKNTVHMCAHEEILVNLDSDNLVGASFPVDVMRQFTEGGFTALQYEDGEGTCGRIACYRSDFDRLRGYDEDAYPMGAQDVDLVLRLKALDNARFRKVKGCVVGQAIHNDNEQKTCCCSPEYGGLRWGRMDTVNRDIFKLRRDRGQLMRNLDKDTIGVKCWRMNGLGAAPRPKLAERVA